MHISGHKAKDHSSSSRPWRPPKPLPRLSQAKPICSLEPQRLQGPVILAPSPLQHCRVGSCPVELGHPCSPCGQQAAAGASNPCPREAAGSMGLGRQGSCPRPLGKAAGRQEGTGARQTHAERGATMHKGSLVWPHAAKGWRSQLADGGHRNRVPPPIFPLEKRACSSACPTRLQTACPPHYFFTARTILYLINNSQVQTITLAVMVQEPHVPGEGEGAGCLCYC